MRWLWPWLLCLAAGAAQGHGKPDASAPLQKVLELLSELSKELPAAQRADERQLEEFTHQANKSLLEATSALQEQRGQSAALKAAIDKAVAKRGELQAERERASTALLEAQTTLSVAKLENDRQSGSRTQRLEALHADAKAVSMALETVRPRSRPVQTGFLLQAARTFERVVAEDRDPRGAEADLSADRAFALRKAVTQIRAALSLSGAPLRPEQQRLVELLPGPQAPAFLQRQSARATKDPMAPLAETLAQVKRQTTSEIQSTEESQKKTQETFAQISKVMNEQIEARKKALQEVDVQLQELEEAASKDKVQLQLVERKAKASAAAAAELRALRERRGADVRARTATRSREAKALAEATRILSAKKASALQEAQQVSVLSFFQMRHAARSGSQIQGTGGELVADSASAAGDQFESVRRLVEDLLRQLHEKQAQDTRRDDWCDSELSATSDRVNSKAAALEQLQTRQTVAASEHESLKAEILRLGESLQALRRAQSDAEDQRRREKAKSLGDETSYEESRRMVHEAVSVLKKVYKDSTDGKGVVGLLEFSGKSYEDLAAETRKAEADAAFEFKRAAETREVRAAGYEADLTYTRQRSEKLALQLQSMKKEIGDDQVQLAALQKYLKQVQAECRPQPEDFASRKAKRDQEIQMLKEAQETLQEHDG